MYHFLCIFLVYFSQMSMCSAAIFSDSYCTTQPYNHFVAFISFHYNIIKLVLLKADNYMYVIKVPIDYLNIVISKVFSAVNSDFT